MKRVEIPERLWYKTNMSSDHVEMEGTIIDSTKGIFRVELEQLQPNGEPTVILCTIAGKLRKNKINLLVGDNVKIKISPYDLSRGIIFYRNKKQRQR